MTQKLYDQDSHCRAFSAQVLTCQPGAPGTWQVTLDRTAFFPEGGGQPADRGTLGGAAVLDVQEVGEAILHTTDAPLTPGTTVQGTLDWPLRFGRMQCHSGEHVISGLAHSLYGCTNVGFHMGEDAVILDFDKELSPAQLREIENQANAIITENRPVTACYPSQAELAALDYRSKLDLTENVVVPSRCDGCLLRPHALHRGDRLIKLLDAMRHRGGIRIWMAAGKMALADYQVKQENIAAISAALSVQQPCRPGQRWGNGGRRNPGSHPPGPGAGERPGSARDPGQPLPLRGGPGRRRLALANAEPKSTGICAVFTGDDQTGYRYVMGSRTVDLRAQAKAINTALGGKGGGQPTMIQGSVTAGQAAILAYFQ